MAGTLMVVIESPHSMAVTSTGAREKQPLQGDSAKRVVCPIDYEQQPQEFSQQTTSRDFRTHQWLTEQSTQHLNNEYQPQLFSKFETGESTRWTNPNNYRFGCPFKLDNDAYGHMNNTKYYELFDTIVNKYLREECREKVPSMGLVVHSSCSYLQPIGFPSPVILGLGVEKIGKSSVIWRIGLWSTTTPNKTSPPTPESVVNQHQLIRDDSMGCIAFGQFVHVFVDHSSRSKIEISPVVRLGASRLLDENLAEK
ncbi:hypothetical protein KEM48_012583 [Puccinia striiformis f. sp. tritici PST-130]|nr:hypothetical protein KEM48_012583 [Puccinia striiformis f. sp. tritici PST-130]